jgi:protein-L-isoaspartate(D-aspartate) O-methyltransferase
MVNDRFALLRHRMVAEQIKARGIRDERLLAAMLEIPRHRFVPPHLADRAYDDGPLPIGEGQTISQPYIVAQMTHALRLTGKETVLEVGTGSGYQTALLCLLAGDVVTVERYAVLHSAAKELLRELGLENVRYRVGDGTMGVPEEAPFDRILVTAASPDVPGPLFEQLADRGILVIPIGGRWEQDLVRVCKESGAATKEFLGGCRFVPLIGQCGFSE